MFLGTFSSVLEIFISEEMFIGTSSALRPSSRRYAIFRTAAIATIVENGDRDAFLDIILVPGSHKRPTRTYLFIAFFHAKKCTNSYMLAPKNLT